MPLEAVSVKFSLENPELTPTVAHALCRAHYADDDAWYDFDPSTIYLDFRDVYQAETHTQVMDKISAVQVLLTGDTFFKRIDSFVGICNTFSFGEPMFSVFDPATPEEIAITLVEVALNREVLPFNYAIQQYTRLQLQEDGTAAYPHPVFDLILGGQSPPKDKETLISMLISPNPDNIDEYIEERIALMHAQFDKVPELVPYRESLFAPKIEPKRGELGVLNPVAP